jgi:hypothetical protein
MVRLAAVSFAAVWSIAIVASGLQPPSPRSSPQGLYAADPDHVWNRLHRHFHVRVPSDGGEYGFDTVDPLLWRETKYLLTGPSHGQAVKLLDEFLASGGERLVADPLKRAVFQHDLWAIFDWLATTSEAEWAPRTALMRRLARVIRRVALTRKQIEALPDTYAAAVASGAFPDRADPPRPFLPRDLLDAAGPWVSVGGLHAIVPHHAEELGRSAFIVLWSLPGGAPATAAYLRKLWDFPEPFVQDPSFPFEGEARASVNPALPPVPDGTRLALVRMMLLIDDAGAIAPTKLIQNVQLRTFPGRQGFAEVTMTRAGLFAGKAGGLRAVDVEERDFITFSAKGMDVFERESVRGSLQLPRVLEGCRNCHHVDSSPATATILSLRHILRPATLVDTRHERWARWYRQPIIAAEAKRRTYTWGVLEGLWQTQPR